MSPNRATQGNIIPAFRPNPIEPYKAPIEKLPLQNPKPALKGPMPIINRADNYVPPRSYKKPEVITVSMPKVTTRLMKKVRATEISDLVIQDK